MKSNNTTIRSFLKKHYSNIIFAVLVVLLLIPTTRTPIVVFVQRLIAFSPSTIPTEEQNTLTDYQWNLRGLNTNTQFNEAQNEVIFVNFWATWCPPCIAEMPSIQKLYDDYGDKVQFFLVSNESQSKIEGFINKNNYTFPVYQALEAPPKILESQALPTTYLISKEGKIVIKETGVADWNSEKTRAIIDELLE